MRRDDGDPQTGASARLGIPASMQGTRLFFSSIKLLCEFFKKHKRLRFKFYSYLNDSTGFTLAALREGKIPESMPIIPRINDVITAI